MQPIAIIEDSESYYEKKLFFENNNIQTLFIRNISNTPIIFKVKTSIHKNCIVMPYTGIIKKGNIQKIIFEIFNQDEIKLNIKFLINIIQVKNTIPSDIWAITPLNDIYQIKFKGVINESQNESLTSSVYESQNESMNESMNSSINESTNEIMNSSINKSINESANEIINESINESLIESVKKTINEIKYEKSLLKKLNKINRNKPIKEITESAIQCNIKNETINYIQYILYIMIFFFGLCLGIKLII